MSSVEKKLLEHLAFIYGSEIAVPLAQRIAERLIRFRELHPSIGPTLPRERVSERDVILITYGDMVYSEGEVPLKTMAQFLTKYLSDTVNTVHILPFYPYSSDDGFSVIDYRRVNPAMGDWEDIANLGTHFQLMFDAVVNHISTQSEWFQLFLRDDPAHQEYFTVVEKGTDLSRVFRPRATPVLTAYQTVSGEKLVWTTFSADQVDLNFRYPDVLIEVIDVLLFYVAHGAKFIRLDAVTYIWKEIGTDCINLPRTHRIVQLLRSILDEVAPGVSIITETNVPHKDNIAYFGNGTNEAQMVYNFALPLLTLHAFHKEDVKTLTKWAATLDLPSEQATLFNFLACHDGIGMMPVKNILSIDDLNDVVGRTQKLGGHVSYKSNEDGSQSPYELNINYLDALSDPGTPVNEVEVEAKRFLASQAIMLALRGIPGIYFHSLFGSRNWSEGVKQTERFRTINREKLSRDQLKRELEDPGSLRYQIYSGFCKLLRERTANAAFHPNGGQKVLSIHRSVFSIYRTSPDDLSQVLCLHSVSNQTIELTIAFDLLGISASQSSVDLLSKEEFKFQNGVMQITLTPYQVLWLQI